MRGRVRFAVAGPGFIGKVHAHAIQRCEGAELRAVLGSNAERSRAFADELGCKHAYHDPAELAAAGDVDAVVIATPNHLHAPLAIQMLEASKHVLVEKPMAMNAGQEE